MEVTHVTHMSWKTRLWQTGALVGLLGSIAIIARVPGWGKHTDEPVKWRPPRIEVLNEAHELSLEVAVVPAHGTPALKTAPGPDIAVETGDVLDVAMRNRSEQEIYVAVLTLNADNGIHWLVPDGAAPQHAYTTKANADNKVQPLAHVALGLDTPPGRLDIIGMFFTEPVPVSEISAALRDGGVNALRNMQHVMAMDTVPATVRLPELAK